MTKYISEIKESLITNNITIKDLILDEYYNSKGKIPAIKFIRTQLGIGLKQAKEIMDGYIEELIEETPEKIRKEIIYRSQDDNKSRIED